MTGERPFARTLHDLAVGAVAGFSGGFVVGLFVLRFFDSIAVPFTAGVVFSVVGAWWLERVGRDRPGITPWRIAAWTVLVLSIAFVALLLAAIASFE